MKKHLIISGVLASVVLGGTVLLLSMQKFSGAKFAGVLRYEKKAVPREEQPIITATEAKSAADAAVAKISIDAAGALVEDGKTLVADVHAAGLVSTMGCGGDSNVVPLYADASLILIEEGCGDAPPSLWGYDRATVQITERKITRDYRGSALSPNRRFQVSLGVAEKTGETRGLTVRDLVRDVLVDVQPIEAPYTYTKVISEFDDLPLGEFEWTANDVIRVSVFDQSKKPGERTVVTTKSFNASVAQ